MTSWHDVPEAACLVHEYVHDLKRVIGLFSSEAEYERHPDYTDQYTRLYLTDGRFLVVTSTPVGGELHGNAA